MSLKLGIIGCGEVVQLFHLPNALALEGVEVGAVCDRDRFRLELARERCGAPLATTDAAELLASDVDAVLIATEDLAHAPLVTAALDAGKHVFVEKPLAVSEDEASECLERAEAAGRVLFVGYQRRFDRGVAIAREKLGERAPGSLRLVHMHDLCHDNALVIAELAPDALRSASFHAGGSDYAGEDAWRSQVEQRFGAEAAERAPTYRLFLNLACHDLSILISLLGEPGEVLFADFSTPLFAVVVYAFGPVRAVLEVGQTERYWFDERLRFVFSDATLELAWPSPFVERAQTELVLHSMVNGAADEERFDTGHGSRFLDELRAFADAALAGADSTGSAAHAVAVNRWIDASIRADHLAGG